MPKDNPRLITTVFTGTKLEDVLDDASAFVDSIPGGRVNYDHGETLHHYGMSMFIVIVWWWKW